MDCFGCNGKGWVDSQYRGAMKCPVCGGTGKLAQTQPKASIPAKVPLVNKNTLLFQLEQWLQEQPGVLFDHVNKTMNTYAFMSKTKNRRMGLVWVTTYGGNRIYLFKGDYGIADPDNKVKYENVWGGYPQFEVGSLEELGYAKRLVAYALEAY
ncbi:MAG: hypothetical protein PHI12_09925 [Dehalococcoidales bacterium]|nr:hypothetical protein [Dehalococcoidales bacterium]